MDKILLKYGLYERKTCAERTRKFFRMVGHVLFYLAFYLWFVCMLPLYFFGVFWKVVAEAFLLITGLSKRYKILTSPDATCLLPSVDVANNRPIVTCYTIVDGRVDGDELRAKGERVKTAIDEDDPSVDDNTKSIFAKLRFYPIRRFGFYLWKLDEDFDSRRHFGPILRPDGTEATYGDEEELRQILNDEWNKPFPENRPLWRAFWIRKRRAEDDVVAASSSSSSDSEGAETRPETPEDGVEAKNDVRKKRGDETCLSIQIHHCMGDGVSFCYAFLPRLFDFDLESLVLRYIKNRIGEDKLDGALGKSTAENRRQLSQSPSTCVVGDICPPDAQLAPSPPPTSSDADSGVVTISGGSCAGSEAGVDGLTGDDLQEVVKHLRPPLWKLAKTLAKGVFGIPGAILRMRTQPDVNPLAHLPLTGKKNFHWIEPIPAERLKRIRNRVGGFTVNDIISTAFARALWRYMITHCTAADDDDVDVEAQRSGYNADPSADWARRRKRIRHWLLSDAATVAFWTKFPDKFKNRFGLCRLRSRPPRFLTGDAHFARATAAAGGDGEYLAAFRRSVLADLVARRREIKRFLKDRNLGFSQYVGMNMVTQFLPVWMADLLMRPPPRGITYVSSNVRGPPTEIMVQGLPLRRIFAFPPQLGTSGVSMMTFGYKSDLLVSVVADTGHLPTYDDVKLVGKYVMDELAAMEDALLALPPDPNGTAVVDVGTV